MLYSGSKLLCIVKLALYLFELHTISGWMESCDIYLETASQLCRIHALYSLIKYFKKIMYIFSFLIFHTEAIPTVLYHKYLRVPT